MLLPFIVYNHNLFLGKNEIQLTKIVTVDAGTLHTYAEHACYKNLYAKVSDTETLGLPRY